MFVSHGGQDDGQTIIAGRIVATDCGNGLWQRIEPLLPEPKAHPKGCRPPIENWKALTGILFVLQTGIPWNYLRTTFC